MFIVPLLISLIIVMVVAATFKKSKVVMSFWLFFVSISLMTLSAVVFVTKQTSYQFPFGIDYTLYLAFYKVKLNIKDILIIYSLSFGVYFFSNMISATIVRRFRIWELLLYMIPAVFFVLFNEPSMSRELYIQAHANTGMIRALADAIMKAIPWMNVLIFLLYAIYPIVLSALHYMRSQIQTRKRLLIHFGAITGLINLFVWITFVRGTFGQILFDTTADRGIYNMISYADYIWAPIGLLLVFSVISFIILVYPRPFRVLYRIYANKNMYINVRQTSQNFSEHLHGDRNFLIALAQYVKIAGSNMQNNQLEKAETHLNNAIEMIEKQLDVTNRQMSLTREKHIILRFENMEELICSALKKTAVPSHITCTTSYPNEKLFVIGDGEHLTEVFVNIFRNAIEALTSADIDSPYINVRLIAEYNLCCVFVTDNGIGINSDDIKSIFHPFYSTKRNSNNSGIGLSYAAEIIGKHNGEIFVRSKRGEYTEFAVVLPMVVKRKRGVLA